MLTHGHPDHARGLAKGAPCPVYATAQTWALIGHYPIVDRRIIRIGRSFALDGLALEAFAIKHSIHAPAVGYRIAGEGICLFSGDSAASWHALLMMV